MSAYAAAITREFFDDSAPVSTHLSLEAKKTVKKLVDTNKVLLAKSDHDLYPLEYGVTIQISINTLNEWLDLHGEDGLVPNEEFYVPPPAVIDFIDEKDRNAGSMRVVEKGPDAVTLHFEKKGHLVGFLRAFESRLRLAKKTNQ